MNQGGKTQKVVVAGVLAALALSISALIAGAALPTANNTIDSAKIVTYDAVAPYVKDYLTEQKIITPEGTLAIPNTSSSGDTKVSEITIEEAINQLVTAGKLEYLKGEKGDTGATGTSGKNGTDGIDGANGANGRDGQDGSANNISATGAITYSGGVISLKPCAINQILSYDGTTWNCATATSSGMDTDTTTTSALLSLDGEILTASVTDSDGNTVSTNQIDLGTTFLDKGSLSNYATTANLSALDARITNLESADYAPKTWVEGQNYLTSSGLASYLSSHDYITGSALGTILSSYLLKNQFATTLNTTLKAGTGISIDEDNTISSLHNADIFALTDDGHLTVANPDANKIYVDTGDDPMTEWFYLNGANGTPADPSSPDAWKQVGALDVDLTPYSTTTEMNTAINNAIANQLNDLASNSDLNTILTDYITSNTMTSAISAATDDMATKTWVNEQNFLTSASLVGNATESWVNAQQFAKTSDLDNFYTSDEVDTMLAQKADQSALDATNLRVSTLEASMDSKQDKLTAGQNITISGSIISANIDLSNYATKSYVDNQDFITNSSALATYATQSYVTSQGYITTAALDGYATEDWTSTQGYLTATDLTGYAKESWVQSQNYLIDADLISYLQTNNYTTAADVTAMLAAADDEYVAHVEFAEVLHENLKAGEGITISADNTISASMFVMVTNRLAVTNPDPGKIYVETGTDSSSPVAQYIYIGGQDGAPADPTQPEAWLKVGDLSGVDLSAYSTTDQMNSAITAAIDAEVQQLNTIYASQTWVDEQGYLKSDSLTDYATQSWVNDNYLASSALNGYATQSWVQAQNYLKSSALNNYATQSWVTSQGYITSAALVGNATQAWVNSQGFLTSDAAAATYVTQSNLSTTLTAYQPLITGGASTITTANLTPNMLLQSNADGKVAASGVSVSSLQTALSDIASLKTQLANTQTSITNLQKNSSLGSWGEVDTGKTFRGKKVYRQDFTLYVNASANVSSDLELISVDNYVDDIINAGGWWTIGYQTERHQIPDAGDGTNYAYVLIYGSGNRLYFRSKANNSRSSATAIIIVEYTKK